MSSILWRGPHTYRPSPAKVTLLGGYCIAFRLPYCFRDNWWLVSNQPFLSPSACSRVAMRPAKIRAGSGRPPLSPSPEGLRIVESTSAVRKCAQLLVGNAYRHATRKGVHLESCAISCFPPSAIKIRLSVLPLLHLILALHLIHFIYLKAARSSARIPKIFSPRWIFDSLAACQNLAAVNTTARMSTGNGDSKFQGKIGQHLSLTRKFEHALNH
jgi:hypothetical protein